VVSETATAFYDSGSSIGGAVAPFLILPIYFQWGWRVAFMIPGLLGFLWLIVWRRMYRRPEEHPLIDEAERRMILAETRELASTRKTRLGELLKLPQTWGTIISKMFTDHAPSDDVNQPVDLQSAALYEEFTRRLLLETANASARPQWKAESFFRRYAGD
jgi:MFS family permease